MRMVETSEASTTAEREALGEMRRQLREWEHARAVLRAEPSTPASPARAPSPEVTYARTEVRPRRRRAAAPPRPPSPPPSPVGGAAAPRTRSRGTVHINLWTLDEGTPEPAPAPRRRALRDGTLDAWLVQKNDTNK